MSRPRKYDGSKEGYEALDINKEWIPPYSEKDLCEILKAYEGTMRKLANKYKHEFQHYNMDVNDTVQCMVIEIIEHVHKFVPGRGRFEQYIINLCRRAMYRQRKYYQTSGRQNDKPDIDIDSVIESQYNADCRQISDIIGDDRIRFVEETDMRETIMQEFSRTLNECTNDKEVDVLVGIMEQKWPGAIARSTGHNINTVKMYYYKLMHVMRKRLNV